MPVSRWSDALGVIWTSSTVPTHFFAEVAFHSGVRSEKSSLLEPSRGQHWGLPSGLVYQAPGFPSSLIVGEAAIEFLDRRHGGQIKEVAIWDEEFRRPMVEALGFLRDILELKTRFAPPIFGISSEPLTALETRRLTTVTEENT
jgi:hypothetical protein